MPAEFIQLEKPNTRYWFLALNCQSAGQKTHADFSHLAYSYFLIILSAWQDLSKTLKSQILLLKEKLTVN